MARTNKQATQEERQQRTDRKERLLSLYVQGLSQGAIGRELGISHTRVGQLIERYEFLPQSRYMLEGALCRDWMLRHRPKEFHRIAEMAAEQHQHRDGKGE